MSNRTALRDAERMDAAERLEPTDDGMTKLLVGLSDSTHEELESLTEHGLRILAEGCRHWQRLAELELQGRGQSV